MRILDRWISAVVLAFACLPAIAEQWVRVGPGPDAYVRGVRFFPNNPVAGQTVLYASTLGAGVLKVVDNGTSLTTTQINSGLPALRIRTIAATDVNTLFAGLDSWGVYKSTNGGATWTASNGSGVTKLGCVNVRNISVRSATEIWAYGACRRDSGIYRSVDGGATWTRLGATQLPDDVVVGSLTFFGTIGSPTNVVIASTARDGIYRSNDNGATWAQINNGIPAPAGPNRISVFNVVTLATAAQLMAYVEGQGIYSSVDGGANWTAAGNGIPANTFGTAGISKESNSILYFGTDKGPIYRTVDGGANWAIWGGTATNSDTWSARGVSIDATAANRYWVHTVRGLVRTNDAGATFTFVPIPEGYVTGANLDSSLNGAYVTAHDVYKVSNIYNPDWTSAVDISAALTGAADGVSVDPSANGALIVPVPNRGVYKTVNDGAAWTKLAIPNLVAGTSPTIERSPSNPQILFAGLDNRFDTATGGGVYKSVDGGATWTDVSSGLATPQARQINSIAMGSAPSVVYLTSEAGIFKSTTGGGSWVPVLSVMDGAIPLGFGAIRVDPTADSVVWAAAVHVDPDGTVRSSSGIYKSIDAGATWTQVLSGKRAIAVRPEISGRVVAGISRDISEGPFIASKDGGVTWQPFNTGVTTLDASGLVRTRGHFDTYLSLGLTAGGTYVLAKPLLTTSVTGFGSVTSNPAGVACPGTCSANFHDYQMVPLTATPASGQSFLGWSGACTGTGACQVRMDAAKSAAAAFTGLAIRTDLNADGRSDVLWRNDSTGQVYRMFMSTFANSGGAIAYTEPNTAWKIVHDADVNSDAVADLVWRNDTTGQVYVMTFASNGMPSGGAVVHVEPNPAWKIVHMPDLDGDAKADLLWWNSTTGQVYAMLLDGATVKSQGMVYTESNTAWKIVAVGDFAGTGKRNQLVWRNSTTGQVYLMTVTAAGGAFSVTGTLIYTEPNTAWKIIAAADFNADGKSDLLWRHDTTGQVYMMLMNGGTIASSGFVYTEPNPAWKIVAQGDYNGDGRADLLWRNETTGQVYMVLMNGLAVVDQAMVYVEPNTTWKIMGTYEYAKATGIHTP